MKASAGSGKTFNLARTYITLLLKSKERYAYRGILAVTFTNKATAEMKTRILKELRTLSVEPRESGYFDFLVPAVLPDAMSLKTKAEQVLMDILHDYSAFAVSTIDRFFQLALRSFAREIGQFSAYQIELDKDSLVRESVDRLLDSITEDDTKLIEWLSESVDDNIEKGQRPDFVTKLYEMAGKLFSNEMEELCRKRELNPRCFFSAENLRSVRKQCREIELAFEKDVRERASAVLAALSSCGVEPEGFSRGFLKSVRGYKSFPEGFSSGKMRPTDSFLASSADPDMWFKKSDAPKLLPVVEPVLAAPLKAFCGIWDGRFTLYNSARIISSQIYSLGLSAELFREFDSLLKEKNVLSIDDSNSLLKKIIDGSDAPFIYEKMGVRFHDFLLDEFQDTSLVQWDNFLPLLKESDSNGGEDLIVGDVKQSIYRWRGSDWALLDTEVGKAFPGATEEHLVENWRSAREIVGFNNAFFKYAAGELSSFCEGAGFSLSDIYSDVAQEVRTSERQDGYVKVEYCPEAEELDRMVGSIMDARAAGALWKDIAVLVSKNKEGESVASKLIASGIPVISDNLLNVKGSLIVKRLVALLGSYNNPDDRISRYLSSSLDVVYPESFHSLTDLCEEMLRQLKRRDESVFEGETLYIQSFMDALLDWTSRNGNNLSEFLEWWDGYDATLSSPAVADAVRVITIHKAKGLEFPHVILPFADSVQFADTVVSYKWCAPDMDPASPLGSGVYSVAMTSAAADTHFASDYFEEQKMNIVDAINTFYVALTRAEKSLYVVAATPPKIFIDSLGKGGVAWKNMSQLLYAFVGGDSFDCGTPYDFTSMKRGGTSTVGLAAASYPSIPLNGRLVFGADSSDFFSGDGIAGSTSSRRLRGIVLHDILSDIDTPADLDAAIRRRVDGGELGAAEASGFRPLLSEALADPRVAPWFAPGTSLLEKERSLIDSDGSVYRPDRVVSTDAGIVVIDFKFGGKSPRYRRQVARYMDIYRRLGYPDVRGFLWYVMDGEIEEV